MYLSVLRMGSDFAKSCILCSSSKSISPAPSTGIQSTYKLYLHTKGQTTCSRHISTNTCGIALRHT